MTAPDNEGSATAFDGFATLIDDEIPGFDSLNNSTFFDQVMNASKLFDGDASAAKLQENLNDSFSLKSATRLNIKARKKSKGTPTLEEPCFSVEEEILEEEGEKDETEVFQDEILFAYLNNKLKKKQQEELGKPGVDEVESVTSATASLSSNGTLLSASAKTSMEDDKTGTKGLHADMDSAPKTPKRTQKPARRSRSMEDPDFVAPSKSTRPQKRPSAEKPRRHQRRASLGSDNVTATGGMDCSLVGERRMDSSSRNRMDSSSIGSSRNRLGSSSRTGSSSRRGSNDRKGRFNKAPETPQARRKKPLRAHSLGKASTDDGETGSSTPKKTKSMDLRRVTRTRTPKRGPRGSRTTTGRDIMERNLQVLDQLDLDDGPAKAPMVGASDRRKKNDSFKQRRSRSFGDASSTLEQQKETALQRATRLSTIQATAAATLTTPKVGTNSKLSVDVDAALSRISRVGLQAIKRVQNNKSGESEAHSSKDDSYVAGLHRAATSSAPATPRRMRRRGSCA